jgi:hypothetical protein
MSNLDNRGIYSYIVQRTGDVLKRGDVIELRRMGERERKAFLKQDAGVIITMLRNLEYKASRQDLFTSAYYEDWYEQLKHIARGLADEKNAEKVLELCCFAHFDDVWNLLKRVVVVEAALDAKKGVPDADWLDDLNVVDEATEEQLDAIEQGAAGLGESSPASGSPPTTPATCSPEEICFPGSETSSTDTALPE